MNDTGNNSSPNIVSPNTPGAGTDTVTVSPTILGSPSDKGIPFIRKEYFDKLPKFSRAVAEVAIENGMLVLQD